jgi:hypothetical protein
MELYPKTTRFFIGWLGCATNFAGKESDDEAIRENGW